MKEKKYESIKLPFFLELLSIWMKQHLFVERLYPSEFVFPQPNFCNYVASKNS